MEEISFDIKTPDRIADCKSAWVGLESILGDLIKRFNVGTKLAVEFGTEFGYSTVALSNYFDRVIGVDTFKGDKHAGYKDTLEQAQQNCDYSNITLFQSDFRDFPMPECDLAHVDIVHEYQPTFDCGQIAIQKSPIVIFHDTESFPEVKQAVADLAKKYNKRFYNYPKHFGLGILI